MKKILYFLLIAFTSMKGQEWEWARWMDSFRAYHTQLLTDKEGNLYYLGRQVINDCTFEGVNLDTGKFIAKFNTQGQLSWAKNIHGASRIKIDDQGMINIIGTFAGTLILDGKELISAGGWDAYLARMNTAGQITDVKSFGGLGDDEGIDIDVSQPGNVFVTGRFSGKIFMDDLSLDQQLEDGTFYLARLNSKWQPLWIKGGAWNHLYGAELAAMDADHIYVRIKGKDSCNYESGDYCRKHYFIAQFSSDGVMQKCITSAHERNYNMLVSDQKVYDLGIICTSQLCEPSIQQFNPDMQIQWEKKFGSENYNLMIGGMCIMNRQILTAGACGTDYTDSVNVGGYWFKKHGEADLVMTSLDSNGNISSFKTVWGNQYEAAYGIAPDESGNCYVLGAAGWVTPDTIHFDDNTTLTGHGSFLARIKPKPVSVKEESKQESAVSVFPNPCGGIATLKCQPGIVKVYDMLGNCVISGKSDQTSFSLDMSGKSDGIYFIRTENNNFIHNTRLILKRRE